MSIYRYRYYNFIIKNPVFQIDFKEDKDKYDIRDQLPLPPLPPLPPIDNPNERNRHAAGVIKRTFLTRNNFRY